MTRNGLNASKSINYELRAKWLSQYGEHYKICEYLEGECESFTHMEIKRLISQDISAFLTDNGIEPSAANIDAFIELLEPTIDPRDYIEELDESEAMDIDTEDTWGC